MASYRTTTGFDPASKLSRLRQSVRARATSRAHLRGAADQATIETAYHTLDLGGVNESHKSPDFLIKVISDHSDKNYKGESQNKPFLKSLIMGLFAKAKSESHPGRTDYSERLLRAARIACNRKPALNKYFREIFAANDALQHIHRDHQELAAYQRTTRDLRAASTAAEEVTQIEIQFARVEAAGDVVINQRLLERYERIIKPEEMSKPAEYAQDLDILQRFQALTGKSKAHEIAAVRRKLDAAIRVATGQKQKTLQLLKADLDRAISVRDGHTMPTTASVQRATAASLSASTTLLRHQSASSHIPNPVEIQRDIAALVAPGRFQDSVTETQADVMTLLSANNARTLELLKRSYRVG